jgi:hypothetical protein
MSAERPIVLTRDGNEEAMTKGRAFPAHLSYWKATSCAASVST